MATWFSCSRCAVVTMTTRGPVTECEHLSAPVDVVLLVDGVDGQHHLCHVELGHVFRKSILELAEQRQQVPAHVVVHHQVLRDKHVNRTPWTGTIRVLLNVVPTR